MGAGEELQRRQGMLHEAQDNPLKMLGHMWNEGPGHRVIMGSTVAPYALEAGAKALETLGKIRWPGGGGGGVSYGRFDWIATFIIMVFNTIMQVNILNLNLTPVYILLFS